LLFLGVLSVLQLILIPGLLLIRLFPTKRSTIQQSVYVFMLSLLANYVVIFALTAVGLYLRSVVLLLFATEVALLVWLYRGAVSFDLRAGFAKLTKGLSKTLRAWSDWAAKDFWAAVLYLLFAVAATVGMVWVLSVWVNNFGTVFKTWDAWASWDRWAEIWADNRLPGDTWEYPQLIPMAYSLSYKFIGTVAVKFFGKSIMPLFSLVIMLMLFDLGKLKRSFGYMLGSVLALYSINLFLRRYIPDGYVDIPVACFSLMAVYSLLKAREISDSKQLREALLLGTLSTAAAAVTKQTGLFLMALYPLLAYLWVLRGNKRLKASQAVGLLAKQFLLALLIVAPWYIYMQYQILYGGNVSNIQYVINDIYDGMSLWQRFVFAVQGLGSYVWLYAFAILSLFVLPVPLRQLTVLAILPFSILWALFLSYEHRNLAIAFPLLSMTVGVAAENWVNRLKACGKRAAKAPVPAYGVMLVAGLLLGLGSLVVNADDLLQQQIKEQRLIFHATVNDKLYDYFNSENGPEPVITGYPIDWLPDLEGMWRGENFEDYEAYQANLLRYDDSTLLLIPAVGIDERILAEVLQNIEDGVYELIFVEQSYMLVRIPPRN
jgi:hypothetical protein